MRTKATITKLLFTIILQMIFLVNFSLFAQKKSTQKVVIEPSHATLNTGETLQFTAKLVDKNGTETDTTFTWSVDATGFGTISDQGLFTAVKRGRGTVYASAGNLIGRAQVTVMDTSQCDECDSSKISFSHLEIQPSDTTLILGESVQFKAYFTDSDGVVHDTTALWELKGRKVGTLTEGGLFYATESGIGIIQASVGTKTAFTRVIVTSTDDTTGIDTVRFRFRDREGKIHGTLQEIEENSVFTIQGLPFPFNLLNGGEIIFPPGSIKENMLIEIGLPDGVVIEGDSVISFTEQILNGIAFHVYINDTLVSPYYFDEPVELVLPFKEELLDSLGISADNLWLFFYSDSSGFDANGITNIVIDYETSKIYAEIIHFSNIVIKPYSQPTGVEDNTTYIPSQFRLFSNYPNPFNPETTIQFMVSTTGQAYVTLTVYNVLGQKVRTLFQGNCEPGIHKVVWDTRNNSGRLMESGIYIYRLQSDNITLTKRMVLLR